MLEMPRISRSHGGAITYTMRRAYDNPPRGNEPIPRREPSPSRGYGDSYNRSGRDLRRRDPPVNQYPQRYRGHANDSQRSSSPRAHRGPPAYEDGRYSSRHSPERWRPQNRDYGNRNYDGYRRPYERNSPRYPSDREYGNRNYDSYRRPPYDERYPRRSRERDDDSYHRRSPPPRPREPANPCKLFIGNVPIVTTTDELISLFGKYGEVVKCDLHKRFAFIEFTKPEDANTALEKMNEFSLYGERLKVNHHTESYGRLRSQQSHDGRVQRQQKIPRVRGFAVTVANIEETTSWQDLKDFGRLAGEVSYASIVMKDGKKFGVIEFLEEPSVKIAMESLQGKQLGKNKIELIEGSLIGNPNSRLDDIQANSESPLDQEDKPKDEDNKDFDDDANAVDYKSE